VPLYAAADVFLFFHFLPNFSSFHSHVYPSPPYIPKKIFLFLLFPSTFLRYKKNLMYKPKSMFSFSSFSACLKDEISKEIFLQAGTANCPFMSFGSEIFGWCFKNLQLSLRIFRNYSAEKNILQKCLIMTIFQCKFVICFSLKQSLNSMLSKNS